MKSDEAALFNCDLRLILSRRSVHEQVIDLDLLLFTGNQIRTCSFVSKVYEAH